MENMLQAAQSKPVDCKMNNTKGVPVHLWDGLVIELTVGLMVMYVHLVGKYYSY